MSVQPINSTSFEDSDSFEISGAVILDVLLLVFQLEVVIIISTVIVYVTQTGNCNHNFNSYCLHYSNQYATSMLTPWCKFECLKNIKACAMLMKTRNHVRFVWEKDGIKSFMLILSILLLCLKLKSTNLISDQTTFHAIVIM